MSLGVIGGLGPMATAYFMQRVIEMTDAVSDQEHLQMIIYNCPNIPDRTSYILDNTKENPVPYIMDIANKLREQQVECIAMPCITAHHFKELIEEQCKIPIIDVVYDTVRMIKDKGIKNIGVMSTDGTIKSKIFQHEIEKQGLELVLPDDVHQKMVMNLIYEDVKKGVTPSIDNFNIVKEHLISKGAQIVVLGCTELSVIKRDFDLGEGICDCLDVLAIQSIIRCNKEIKSDYKDIIKPISK